MVVPTGTPRWGGPYSKRAKIMNWLGDDISYKSLHAVQAKIYETREEAIAEAILWCSRIDKNKVIEYLNRGIK